MLKTLLKSNTIPFDEIFRIFEQGHAQNMQNQIEDQKKRKFDAGIVNSENTSIGCKICKTFTSCEKLSSHFYLVHCTNTKCCRFCEEMYVGNVHYCCKEKEPKYIARKIQMSVIKKRLTKKRQVLGQVLGQVFCHCKICKVGFLSLPKLNAHIFNEHKEKHECVLCETIFASANCAEKHLCTEMPKQLKEKNDVTGLYEICYDKQKDAVQKPKDLQNQSITNYLKCPDCDEEIGVDDFNENTELQYQVIYTCRNCKLDFKSIFCTRCKCPFDSLEMLYSHFYSQHRKDIKCCLFCRLAYVGDNHYCGKGESSEKVTKREGSYYKMYYKKKFKKQKCLQCEYIINFCKENTDHCSCSRLDCIACRKVGECHGDKCYICGQVFHSFSHRSYHEYNDHQDEVIELWWNRKKDYRREYLNDYNIKRYQQKRKDQHKCRFCDKRFTYSVKKKQHESDAHGVHGSNKYHCDVCDQKYGSFERMKKHMEEHYKSEGTPNTEERLAKIEEMLPKKDKRVMCHECGKLVLKKYLNAHLRIHLEASNDGKTSPTTVGKIACYKCGQMVKKKNFNAHFRERHKEKEVMCEICGKMFFHRGRLNEHKKIKHSGDIEKKVKKKGPPQQCNVCGKILASKKCLYVHEKMKHSQGKFQCQICFKKFFYNFLLRDHIKHVHEKFNPIVCHYCNYRCYMKSSLVKHMHYHH
ncbi:KRAB [Mytilus coruscus]|uniref:KRAB n=1 Tax=Mytilus coruscus TaxID=42192 RepID=A0A6J8BM93_MYTCO|nr:KRAB [Mytilus coruscus]